MSKQHRSRRPAARPRRPRVERDHRTGLPDRDELLRFIAEHGTTDRREIARAYSLRGAQRAALRTLLRALEDEGILERQGRRGVRHAAELPPVAVIEVTGIDADGDLLARPTSWSADQPPPPIYVELAGARIDAPGVGDRLLARLRSTEDGGYEARPMRRLPSEPSRIVGVFHKASDGGRISPVERGNRNELMVATGDAGGAGDGDLVVATLLPGRRYGLARAAVQDVVGSVDDPHAISLIAIQAASIPHDFPEEVLTAAAQAAPAPLDGRVDLRDHPLVTIDGADARDFDDAVFAEPDSDRDGGWHLIVAIADVAWYVRPSEPLDREAYDRGNSVYFPDRVVPMLPEALSNDLCSLRPDEDRACLAAHLWIDETGRLRRHRFERAAMRSASRLTYEAAQAARDSDQTLPGLPQDLLPNLYGAHATLAAARCRRGALELDLPERKVHFDDDGRIDRIAPVARLDSHRLIEEFMITANVAAAKALERRHHPCMYRVHDQPDPERVEDLRRILAEYDLKLPRGQTLKPTAFNRVLSRIRGKPGEQMVNQLVLRTQAQAVYSPDNLGHFGLALRRYAHFTSPIRRYADLLVHRSLISALGLGDGGLPAGAGDRFAEAGTHISATERRATLAERGAMDRYLATYLADRVGATFAGRVSGVTRFGLFVTLGETGADGLVPVSRLPGDYYRHDHQRHALVGDRTGRAFRLGDNVEVRLAEADGITGSLALDLLEAPAPKPRRSGRGRPAKGRRRVANNRR